MHEGFRRGVPSAGGEDHPGLAAALDVVAIGTEQIRDAPRDRRRRIDPFDRPGREPDQPVQQQRVMRAGQHNRVGARRPIDEAGRDLGEDIAVADGFAVQGGLGQRGEAEEPTSLTSQPCA